MYLTKVKLKLLTKKIIMDEVLVIEDAMEGDMVDKEVLNTVLVKEDTKHKSVAAPIGHRVYIRGTRNMVYNGHREISLVLAGH